MGATLSPASCVLHSICSLNISCTETPSISSADVCQVFSMLCSATLVPSVILKKKQLLRPLN